MCCCSELTSEGVAEFCWSSSRKQMNALSCQDKKCCSLQCRHRRALSLQFATQAAAAMFLQPAVTTELPEPLNIIKCAVGKFVLGAHTNVPAARCCYRAARALLQQQIGPLIIPSIVKGVPVCLAAFQSGKMPVPHTSLCQHPCSCSLLLLLCCQSASSLTNRPSDSTNPQARNCLCAAACQC